jgi:hypothetical protein
MEENIKLILTPIYDYTVVMAWYNVREKEQNPLRNTQHNNEFVITEDYIKQSRIFIEKEYPLVIFVEPGYEQTFWDIRPRHLHHITRIITKDYDELYGYSALFPRFSQNFAENPVENLHREKFTALYNFIVNQKVEFVREVVQWNPFQTPKFGWMDLRLHDISVGEINDIFRHFPEDRILITQSWFTESYQVADRREWFRVTRGKVCAGFFAGYAGALMKFCERCRRELINAVEIGTAPTDEMIYSVVVAENLDAFEPNIGDYPDVLHNILYNRANAFYTMNYLNWAYERGHWYYVDKICENLREAYHKNTVGFGCEDLHKVWYYNLAACLNLEKKHELLEDYFDILKANDKQREYFVGVCDKFKENLMINDEVWKKYMNIIL